MTVTMTIVTMAMTVVKAWLRAAHWFKVGRACYQSHTHRLEPFNWDGDGACGNHDAHHPIFDLYVTTLVMTLVTTRK